MINPKHMKKSDSIKELATALNKAQAMFKSAVKDSANPFFKSKYADLSSVWEAVREGLQKHGLSVAQTMDFEGAENFLVTTLMHTSGEWIQGRARLKPVKDSPQDWGSAITYFRRYSLAAILGVVQDDDDANKASVITPAGGPIQVSAPAPKPLVKKTGQQDDIPW